MGKLTICSTRGHRRAGRQFSKEQTVYDEDDFTAAELAQLKADPDIVIIEGEAKKASGDAQAEKQLQSLTEGNEKLEAELEATNAKVKSLADDLKSEKAKNTDLTKKLEKATAEIEKLKSAAKPETKNG